MVKYVPTGGGTITFRKHRIPPSGLVLPEADPELDSNPALTKIEDVPDKDIDSSVMPEAAQFIYEEPDDPACVEPLTEAELRDFGLPNSDLPIIQLIGAVLKNFHCRHKLEADPVHWGDGACTMKDILAATGPIVSQLDIESDLDATNWATAKPVTLMEMLNRMAAQIKANGAADIP
jgi:hypothetical protein